MHQFGCRVWYIWQVRIASNKIHWYKTKPIKQATFLLVSSDRCADPSANHISIHGRLPPETNSAHHKYSHGHTSQLPPMNCGDWIYVRIQLFIKQNAIVVFFSDEEDTQSNTVTNMLPVLTVSNINIKSYLDDESSAWIGFTASTGGLAQSHQVKLSGVQYLKKWCYL